MNVYRHLRERARSRNRADELAREVLAAAAVELPAERAGDPPILAWLYAVARRRFVQAVRRGQRGPDELPLARGSTDYGPFVARGLHEALQELPGGHSRVVVLKLFRGLSFAEIAHEVGLTEGATKSRFKVALEGLRSQLAERAAES